MITSLIQLADNLTNVLHYTTKVVQIKEDVQQGRGTFQQGGSSSDKSGVNREKLKPDSISARAIARSGWDKWWDKLTKSPPPEFFSAGVDENV